MKISTYFEKPIKSNKITFGDRFSGHNRQDKIIIINIIKRKKTTISSFHSWDFPSLNRK